MPLLTGSPVERLACDLAGPFPRSTKGHAYILTAICAFTKFIILVPLGDKTAVSVAKAIFEKVFLKFGAGEILTDNVGEFRCELDELCRVMGVARSYTTAFQPSTNELCERSHQTINAMLAKSISDNQKDWTDHLQQVAFCFNASVQESTKNTPFFLMHGTEPRWGVDLQFNCEHTRTAHSVNDYADFLVTRLEKAHELVRAHLRVSSRRMKDWFDKKVCAQTFKVGDEVYVLNLRLCKGRLPKWVKRYSHIAVVQKRLNNVMYQIHCAGWIRKKTRIVHVDKMKLCRSSAATAAVEDVEVE